MAEHLAERDRKAHVPKPTIDPTPTEDAQGERARRSLNDSSPASEVGQTSPHKEADATEEGASFRRARQGARAWLHETFPGHENAVIGGFVGFLVALLFFVIGFWRTLLVVVLVVVGVAFGQLADGDPKIIDALRGIFRGDDGR